MKNNNLFKKIIFTILTWALVLFSINFVCKLIIQNRYIAVDPINKKTADTSYGYFKPHQDKIILFPGLKPYRVKINSLGLRSVGPNNNLSLKDIADHYKILSLGDSITFGLFINDNETYPYQLQSLLHKQNHKATVLNAGVGNGTMIDYTYYLRKKGFSLKPNLVIVNFCTNDLGEIKLWQKPLYEKLRDENVFDLAKTIKLASFMRIFRKFELAYRYKRSVNKIKNEEIKNILLENRKNLQDILKVALYVHPDVIADAHGEELKPYWKAYFDALGEFSAILQNQNIDLLFVIYPSLYLLFNEMPNNHIDKLVDYLEKNNIPYINLLEIFQQHKEQYTQLYNDPPRDFHLGFLGNQLLAQEIFKTIKPLLQKYP